MKTTSLMCTFILTLLLSGCGNHVYTKSGKCITCFNNPVTKKPLNHDGSANKATASTAETNKPAEASKPKAKNNKPLEHKFTFSVPVGVDFAFVRIKREFKYQTDQEIKQEWGRMASMKMKTFAWAYDAVPSAYYHMRAVRHHDDIELILDSLIEKSTDKQSLITMTFWSQDKSIDVEQLAKSLEKRTKNALSL